MLFDISGNDIFALPGNMFVGSNIERPKEGLKKGNMFNNEYVPYKNYTFYDVKPDSEKSAMLLEIMSYSFAINDLNLYLDLHRNDDVVYNLFKEYVNKELELEKEYVNKYGPLCVKESGNSFDWLKNNWPWNSGGVDYV